MEYADCESRPEVGSSRNKSREGFRRQLYTNGEPFALLYSKGHDYGILDVAKLQEVNDFINVGKLLLLGYVSILT